MLRGEFILAGLLLSITSPSVASVARLECRITVSDEVRFSAFSPDGKIAGVLKSNNVGIWSVAGGRQIQMLDFGTERPVFLDFLDNGTHLLVGLYNGKIQLHEVQTGKVLRTLENGAPPSIVRVSKDGKLMATTAANREIHLWDLAAGTLSRRIEPNLGDIEDLAFSPDGTLLASSADDTDIYIWDTKTGQRRTVVRDLLLTTFGLAFAPDGKWLYAGNGDHVVHVIDAGTGKMARSFPPQKYPVIALSLSQDGQRVAAVYRDANEPEGNTPIVLWSAESGQMLQKADSPKVKANGGGFASDGRLFYSTSNGKELQVWSLR